MNIFFYNEKVQEILYQFKGCKDYEMRTVFLEYFADYLNYKFKNYIIVPAPSFIESDEERVGNQGRSGTSYRYRGKRGRGYSDDDGCAGAAYRQK